MLKLKLQHFGHLMRRTDSLKRPWCWERLRAGGEGDDRGWDGWIASSTWQTRVWASSESGDGQGSLACCSPWGFKELDTTEQLNWTDKTTRALGLPSHSLSSSLLLYQPCSLPGRCPSAPGCFLLRTTFGQANPGPNSCHNINGGADTGLRLRKLWVPSPPLANRVSKEFTSSLWSFHVFTLKMGRRSALPSSQDCGEDFVSLPWGRALSKCSSDIYLFRSNLFRAIRR